MATQVGSAIFKVGLRDSVSGPARRMGSAVGRLEGAFARIDKQRKKEEAAKNRLQTKQRAKEAAMLGRSYEKMASGLKMATYAAGATAVVLGGALAVKLYKLTDLASRTGVAFKNIFRGDAAGQQRMAKSLDMAEKFGMSIGSVLEQTSIFGGLGFNDKQIDAMINMGADMQALGRTPEQVERVFLQLGQIAAKGKLQGEELIVLAENGINLGMVYERLGKKLGKTREELVKMQQAGEIKSSPALNAIAETIQAIGGKGALGEAGEEAAANTVGGLIGKITTRLDRGLFEAAKAAEPALTRGMQAIFEGQKLADGTIGASAFTTVLEGIGRLLERIGPMLPNITENFTKAFGAAAGFDGTSIDKFADGLPNMATRLGEIAGSLLSIASTIAKLEPMFKFFSFGGSLGKGGMGEETNKAFVDSRGKADPMLEGLDMGKIANAPLNDIKPGYWTGVWERVRKSLGGMNEDEWGRMFGQRIAAGVATGIAANTHMAEDAARNMAMAVDSATRKEAEVHSPSQKMVDIGMSMGEGTAVGLDGSTEMVIRSAQGVTNSALESVANELRSASGNYGAITSGAAENLSGGSSGVTISIGDISITVEGAGDATAVATRLYDTFETEFADLINRRLEGVGA